MAEIFDIGRLNRLKNIFAPENLVGTTPAPASTAEPKREYPAHDRFMEAINQMPTREQHSPSNWRRLGGAIIGGFRSGREGMEFTDAPYQTALQDWKLKTDALANASSHERMLSSAQDRDAYNQLMMQWRGDQERRLNEQGGRRLTIAEQNAETSRMRTETAKAFNEFRMNNPDLEFAKQEGGNYQIFNPKTGEIKDSGVTTGTLSQLDELNLRIKSAEDIARMREAGANARNASTNATSRQNTADRIAAGIGTDDSSISETQRKQGMINRANEFKRANPTLANWIEIVDGNVEIVPQNISWGRDDPDEVAGIIKRIRGYIDPDYKGPIEPSVTTTGSVTIPGGQNTAPKLSNTPLPPTPQAGRVIVEKDGKQYSLPAAQLQQAIAQGYKEVKK